MESKMPTINTHTSLYDELEPSLQTHRRTKLHLPLHAGEKKRNIHEKCNRSNVRGDFRVIHNQSKILVFSSPIGYMLWPSFGYSALIRGIFHRFLSNRWKIFPKSWNSTGYFFLSQNLTGSSVSGGRFLRLLNRTLYVSLMDNRGREASWVWNYYSVRGHDVWWSAKAFSSLSEFLFWSRRPCYLWLVSLPECTGKTVKIQRSVCQCELAWIIILLVRSLWKVLRVSFHTGRLFTGF